MQPIPIPVKNVTVYAYFDPREPLSEVILTGGAGTYSVGTLTTNIFYNLDLEKAGRKRNPLNIHGKYYATGETESGERFTTPWMYCLDNGKQPKFGRTIQMAPSANTQEDLGIPVGHESGFIKLGPLTDITVSQIFPPPAIGQELLISNGKGYIIATRIGTPHEMGVQVDSGARHAHLMNGSKNVIITGRTQDGHLFSQTGYTIISNGDPAIFLRVFP